MPRYYILRPKSKNVFFQFNGNITNALWLQLFPTINNSSLILLETDVIDDESVVSLDIFYLFEEVWNRKNHNLSQIHFSYSYRIILKNFTSSAWNLCPSNKLNNWNDLLLANSAKSCVVWIYSNGMIIHFHIRSNVRFVYTLVKLSFIVKRENSFTQCFMLQMGKQLKWVANIPLHPHR